MAHRTRIVRVFLAVAAVVWLTPHAGFAQTPSDDLVHRGSELSGAPAVNLVDVLNDVDAYADQLVTVEGTVKQVCQMMGCWMELVPSTPASETTGVRVTFKDYGFFVPKDSAGRQARLEGQFETNVFSKEDADHLIAEGVSLTRRADGTATEVSFVAAGVELRPVS